MKWNKQPWQPWDPGPDVNGNGHRQWNGRYGITSSSKAPSSPSYLDRTADRCTTQSKQQCHSHCSDNFSCSLSHHHDITNTTLTHSLPLQHVYKSLTVVLLLNFWKKWKGVVFVQSCSIMLDIRSHSIQDISDNLISHTFIPSTRQKHL